MKLLADEGVHYRVVMGLRAKGVDVEWVAETMPGTADAVLLARTDMAAHILVTYDRDFGDLIFNRGMPAPGAILYNRLDRLAPDELVSRILAILAQGDLAGHFIAITKRGNRFKPFPGTASTTGSING